MRRSQPMRTSCSGSASEASQAWCDSNSSRTKPSVFQDIGYSYMARARSVVFSTSFCAAVAPPMAPCSGFTPAETPATSRRLPKRTTSIVMRLSCISQISHQSPTRYFQHSPSSLPLRAPRLHADRLLQLQAPKECRDARGSLAVHLLELLFRATILLP